jgi:hypothetical protein
MQVTDDLTFGSAPTRPLSLTPVLLLDEGPNFLLIAKYKLVWAGHRFSISPTGIWRLITVVWSKPGCQEGSDPKLGLPTLHTSKVTTLRNVNRANGSGGQFSVLHHSMRAIGSWLGPSQPQGPRGSLSRGFLYSLAIEGKLGGR